MPADQPQIGETWEFYDTQVERASQAVVVEVRPAGPGQASVIRLVNRLGRSMVVPERSFLLVWHFVHPAPSTECTSDGCTAVGCFQVHDERGWVYSCERHLRMGAQALLPADRPQDRDVLLEGDHQCPQCNTTSSYPGSGEECDLETSMVVRRCGRCGSQWVLILGSGDDTDGLVLSEAVSNAADALHGRVVNVRAVVGHAAWLAIRRVIQPATQIVGVPVQQGPHVGALNVVVIGQRISTGGVRRLGGGSPTVRAPSSTTLLPGVGTIWRNSTTDTYVEVKALHEFEGAAEVDYSDGAQTHRMGVRDFLRTHIVSDTQARPTVLKQSPPVAIPLGPPGPRPGETWWLKGAATRPVLVLALDVNDAGRSVVRYKDVADEDVTTEVGTFLESFVYDPPDPGCAVGEEWVDADGSVYRIDEVRLARREIVISSPTSTRGTVPLARFVMRFRKLVRKSVYSRLASDDDDF